MKLISLTLLSTLSALTIEKRNLQSDNFAKYQQSWTSFKNLFSKNYARESNEEHSRFKTWLKNKLAIDQHNKLFEQGKTSFKMKLNKFSDLNEKERVLYTGFLMDKHNETTKTKFVKTFRPKNTQNPSSIDWRDYGYVTNVKDQGQCGSCWAFSAVGSLEGAFKKAYNTLPYLSEQDLVDCSFEEGNGGCQGGWMNNAFQAIINQGGIDYDYYYPYQAVDYYGCRHTLSANAGTIRTWVNINRGDEKDLETALATVGPISIAMDVSHNSFYNYRSGVWYEPNCSTSYLSHAMTLVGYGVENGIPYWLVKNSWGTYWGDNGYIKVAKGYNNMCGIASAASYPVF